MTYVRDDLVSSHLTKKEWARSMWDDFLPASMSHIYEKRKSGEWGLDEPKWLTIMYMVEYDVCLAYRKQRL